MQRHVDRLVIIMDWKETLLMIAENVTELLLIAMTCVI